jgi:hypothetical protein
MQAGKTLSIGTKAQKDLLVNSIGLCFVPKEDVHALPLRHVRSEAPSHYIAHTAARQFFSPDVFCLPVPFPETPADQQLGTLLNNAEFVFHGKCQIIVPLVIRAGVTLIALRAFEAEKHSISGSEKMQKPN